MELRRALIIATTELVKAAPPTITALYLTFQQPTTADLLAVWEEPEIAAEWRDLDSKMMALPALVSLTPVIIHGRDLTDKETTALHTSLLGRDLSSTKTIMGGHQVDCEAFFARVLPRVYRKGIFQMLYQP